MKEATFAGNMPNQKRRSFWLKHLHQWHWISSAICLIAMLLFAATGITLNHSAQIEAHPQVSGKQAQLPKDLLTQLSAQEHKDKDAIPAPLTAWLDRQFAVDVGGQIGEWSPDELYVALPRPGGDAWLRVDLGNGKVEYEKTDRGWVSYFNDLHKGRNTGAAWGWFIDIFAVACLVFCVTGLFLLQLHAGNRPVTWPLVGLGLVVPLLLAIVFIH
jgi:hypothetical protein